MGVTQPQAKERQGVPATTGSWRGAWNGVSLSPQGEPTLLRPESQTSGLQYCEQYICAVSAPACGT